MAKLVPASAPRWDRAAVLDEADALPLADLLQLARRHDLSAYDAAYLALAVELKLPLACGDGALKAALPRAGVKLA